MKRKTLFLGAFFCFFSLALQAQWATSYTNSSGTRNYCDAKFISNTVGYVLAQEGEVLKTTDGGATWTAKTPVPGTTAAGAGSPKTMASFDFISENTGFVVGQSGLIYKTTDGAQTWSGPISIGIGSTTPSGTITRYLNSIRFYDSNTGFILGNLGTVIKTIDGGTTWNRIINEPTSATGFPNTSSHYYYGSIIDATTLRIAPAFYTMGLLSGTTLTAATNITTNSTYYGSYFFDANNGYVVGYRGIGTYADILKTTDGGTTWTQTINTGANNTTTGTTLRSVTFTDTNNGIAVGLLGTVYETSNAGTSWTKNNSAIFSGALLNVSKLANGHKFIVGVNKIFRYSIPVITGATNASAFTTTYGTASGAQTFSVSGSYLTANLIATAPTGFEVSSDGTTYGSTATFTQSNGSASGTLSIRLKADATVSGTYNSQNIVLSSTGATSVNIVTAASGNVVSPATASNSGGNLSASGLTDLQLANSNLTISSGEFIIDATKTVRSLTVAPGAKLTLSSGSLTATSGITLQSTSSGTATFVDNNNISPQTVTATVEQYLGSATARNYYITPPVSGASVPTGQTYYSYDETGSNTGFVNPATLYWKAETEGSTLDPRKGYIAQTTGVTTLSFTGTLNTGSQTPLTLTRTSLAAKPGFNLVANPYPSYLDWKLVSAANSGLTTTAWFRTKDNSGGYIFATVNVATPSSPVIVAVDPNTTITTLIPPMQAYWVRVNAVGSTTYNVNNTMRAHADNTGNKFKAPAQSTQPMLRLRVSNGTSADETVVLFNANATNGMDMFDSPKMSNNSTSVPEIFTQIDTEKLVINGMKNLKYDTEIPIGFSTLTTNDFTISANEISNFETGTRVILLDKLNPTVETELSNGAAYNFSAPVTTANIDRFSVIFRAPGVATGVDNGTKLNAQVFVNANNQIAIIAPEKATYSIYNAVGQLVNKSKTTTDRTIVNTIRQAGVYVVKLTENGTELTTRVIIK